MYLSWHYHFNIINPTITHNVNPHLLYNGKSHCVFHRSLGKLAISVAFSIVTMIKKKDNTHTDYLPELF